jgi:hypothetical protein
MTRKLFGEPARPTINCIMGMPQKRSLQSPAPTSDRVICTISRLVTYGYYRNILGEFATLDSSPLVRNYLRYT